MEYALKLDSPNQPAKSIKLTGDKILLGTLLSNHIVLQGKGIDPIHALIESYDDGKRWGMTDLGSQTGIKLNGQLIEVEADISPSDVIEIGDNKLVIEMVRAEVAGRPAPPPFANKTRAKAMADKASPSPAVSASKAVSPIEPEAPLKRIGASLFNIKEARPRGRVLEVVAYWDQTILEAEYFHKDFKDFNKVTIGSTGRSHFIAANKDSDNIKRHVLAKFDSGGGYKLRLLDGMTARIRKGGKVVKLSGKQSVSLGNRDIVHIVFGAVKYFLIFVKPPEVILPPARNRDPLFTGLLMIAMMIYLLCIPTLWYIGAKITESRKDDIWAVIYKPIKKPKPIKKVVTKKKIAKIKDKKPIKKPPPPPKPKPVKPAKATAKKKPKKTKVRSQVRKQKRPVKIGGSVTKPKKRAKPKRPSGGKAGIRSSGVGNRKKMGGGRKGKGRTSVKGVKNVNNKKSSGVNLSKLGVDVGMVLSKRGPGARYTDFKSSAGGAGGGRGSQVKTTGLGGLGKQHSLSVRGTKGALNKFGSGQGVLAGGGRGSGLGKGFGRGSGRGVSVNLLPGDGVVDGGLTMGEVARVIRQNNNAFRHCYEQLLQRQPGRRGKVKAKFVIATNGRVRSSSIIRSDIGDGSFKNCVRSRLSRLKFPRPRGGSKVDVSYPFVFNPV